MDLCNCFASMCCIHTNDETGDGPFLLTALPAVIQTFMGTSPVSQCPQCLQLSPFIPRKRRCSACLGCPSSPTICSGNKRPVDLPTIEISTPENQTEPAKSSGRVSSLRYTTRATEVSPCRVLNRQKHEVPLFNLSRRTNYCVPPAAPLILLAS